MHNLPKRDEVYSAEERAVMLKQMQVASDTFYRAARQIGCHPFIEFAGLMNEYIKLCEQAQKADIDFTNANAHSGNALPMQPYNVQYLAEKLECIYGPTLQQNPELQRVFLTRLGLVQHSVLGADDFTEVPANFD